MTAILCGLSKMTALKEESKTSSATASTISVSETSREVGRDFLPVPKEVERAPDSQAYLNRMYINGMVRSHPSQPSPSANKTVKISRYLTPGTILFNPPEKMKAGVKERIEVRISHADIPTNTILSGLAGNGTPTIGPLVVSTFMKVRLIDNNDAFDVRSINSEEQYVPIKWYAQWNWDVVPLRRGTFDLQLVVSIRVTRDDESGEKDLPVIQRTITVKVNPAFSIKRFCKAHIEWIIGGILGSGIFGWIWKKLHTKRKKHRKNHGHAV